MTPLDAFLPLIRGRLPGCPDIVLKDAVRDACIEFCRRTELLTEDISLSVTADDPAYALTASGGDAWEVLSIRRESSPLQPVNRQEFTLLGLTTQTGTPGYYYLEGDGALVLGPIPDADETLTVLVTVVPAENATTVPDALYQDHRETIAAGARAWVRRNLGDWVNPELEAMDRKAFEYAIHNQNIHRARGGANTPLRVRTHSF